MKEYTKKKVAGEENTQKFDLENSENQEIINDLVLERKKSQQLEDLLQSEVNIEFDKNKAKCVCLAEEVKKLLETMENMKKDSEIEKNDTKNEYENRLKVIFK